MYHKSLFTIAALLALSAVCSADFEILTFDHEFQNADHRNVDRSFLFPDTTQSFERIYMYYRISCPTAPGDCDPWDRLGHISALRDVDGETEALEIARVVTPYDITGSWGGPYGTGPDSCTFEFDVTDYQSVLRDSVTFRSYIDTWIWGDEGWLITVTFEFIEGLADPEPYRVERIWNAGWVEYGNPENPWSEQLPPAWVSMDDEAEAAVLRIFTTGHGQGNTDNAAEFSYKQHNVLVGVEMFSHFLWRDDCNTNPCSGQGGTWWYDRAGWCPGAGAYPWDLQVDFTPGEELFVDYWAEGYTNECRPNNPDCVDGATCPDCDYNYEGHTQPGYVTQGQMIYYRAPQVSVDRHPAGPAGFVLGPNAPNPFNPLTVIRYELERSGRVRLEVRDLGGREVAVLAEGLALAGKHEVVFDARGLSSGVYFYTLQVEGRSRSRKMLFLK